MVVHCRAPCLLLLPRSWNAVAWVASTCGGFPLNMIFWAWDYLDQWVTGRYVCDGEEIRAESTGGDALQGVYAPQRQTLRWEPVEYRKESLFLLAQVFSGV